MIVVMMIVSVIMPMVMVIMFMSVIVVVIMPVVMTMIMPVIVGVSVDGGIVVVGVPGGVFPFPHGQFDSDHRFHVAARVVPVRDDQPNRSPLRIGERAALPLVDQNSLFNRLLQRDTGGKFSIQGMERHMVGLGERIRLL